MKNLEDILKEQKEIRPSPVMLRRILMRLPAKKARMFWMPQWVSVAVMSGALLLVIFVGTTHAPTSPTTTSVAVITSTPLPATSDETVSEPDEIDQAFASFY